MLFRRLALAALCVATAAAQSLPSNQGSTQPGQQSQQKPAAPGSISGRVVSTNNGQPLKKAWVVARVTGGGRQAPQMVLTDADGNFKFKEIPAGRVTLIASKNGYVTQPYGKKSARGGASPITVGSGQDVKDILFRLQRGGTIAGRIVDEDGEPVINAQVQALRYQYMDGQRRLIPAGARTTDDRGEFRIPNLEPRTYYVRANFRGLGFGMGAGAMVMDFGGPLMGSGTVSDENSDEGYAPLYYPGSADIAGAVSVDVPSGDEVRADITFIPMHTFRVRGRVLDANGEAATRTQVMLTPRNSKLAFSMDYMAFLSPGGNGPKDGKFEIRGVLPGSYTLSAVQFDETPQSGHADVEVGGANVDDVNVMLSSGKDISGVLRVDGSSIKLKNLSVAAVPVTNGRNMFFGGDGQVKEDGTFTLSGMAGEDYRISVGGLDPGMYLKSAKYGNDDVLENGLNPSRGKGGTLELVVSANGGKVDGTVNDSDGASAPAVTVVLMADETSRYTGNGFEVANTDQYGKFQFQGLRPGKYKLYALEDIDVSDVGDPDYMKKYEDRATSITVSEGAKVSQDLKLITSDSAKDQQASN